MTSVFESNTSVPISFWQTTCICADILNKRYLETLKADLYLGHAVSHQLCQSLPNHYPNEKTWLLFPQSPSGA